MIQLMFEYKEDDVRRFFEGNGIRVAEGKVPTLFGCKQGPLMVTNPANGQTHPMDKAFVSIMEARARQLLMTDIDKLTIYQSLNNLK